MLSMGRLSWIVVLVGTGISLGAMVDFEPLSLPAESYWNGSDQSGGFVSGNAFFANLYNADWDSWEGFSYSNITDTTASGYTAQYNAIPGSGQGGSANYAIGYVGYSSVPTVTLDTTGQVDGLYVTNTNYAYYSMRDGDMFARQFGGLIGDDPDWFELTVTGKDLVGSVTGTVEVYLADFRFDQNAQDFILDTWQYVDLSSLGAVKSLEFTLSSSDVGDYGMNTPATFAIDTMVPEPGTWALLAIGSALLRRKRNRPRTTENAA